MSMELALGFQEKVVYGLRGLYSRYGYSQYKMSKFEEYDLYAKNKDFLISDQVITFMDLGGKLMALKPDVTLSIVKNTKDSFETVQKLYYNENIYRVTKGTGSFREMMQVGLECIGRIDAYCMAEVITLAQKSLKEISEEFVLNVSHLGLLTGLLEDLGLPKGRMDAAFAAIGEKNVHDLRRIFEAEGLSSEAEKAAQLAGFCGTPEEMVSMFEKMNLSESAKQQVSVLESICSLIPEDLRSYLRIDFSVVDDVHYYNGIVFKGFVPGVPNSVLSGGQYDNLMRKMQKKSDAIGFAVYLDSLERLGESDMNCDIDVLVLYSSQTDVKVVSERVDDLRKSGKSVLVQLSAPEGLRYGQLIDLSDEVVK